MKYLLICLLSLNLCVAQDVNPKLSWKESIRRSIPKIKKIARKAGLGLLLIGVSSCPVTLAEPGSHLIPNYEDPEILNGLTGGEPYITNFFDLPRGGFLSLTPFSGTYWPTSSGGTSVRWNGDLEDYSYDFLTEEDLETTDLASLSPTEKYDLYNDDTLDLDFPLTTLERERTEIMKTVEDSSEYVPGHKIPRWFGLCHVWAYITYRFKNPGSCVMSARNGLEIPFGSSDVKALLNNLGDMYNSNSRLIGKRCNLDVNKLNTQLERGEISQEEFDEMIESPSCRGINPATLQILLANKIGLRDEAFIMDKTRFYQVWNQPIYAFDSRVLGQIDSGEDFPRGAVKELQMSTRVKYVQEIHPQFERVIEGRGSSASETYLYSLYLDKGDNIIGGRWVSKERPDFLWDALPPRFQGALKRLKEIYLASTSDL